VTKHYPSLKTYADLFEQTIDADAHSEAIERIVQAFGDLQSTVSWAIRVTMGPNGDAAKAITSEMSFKNQTLLMSVLATHSLERQVPAIIEDPEGYLSELVEECSYAEKLWSWVMHAAYGDCGSSQAVARATIGKVEHDVHTPEYDALTRHLEDIGDIIVTVSEHIRNDLIFWVGESDCEQVDVTDADPTLH